MENRKDEKGLCTMEEKVGAAGKIKNMSRVVAIKFYLQTR